MSGRGMRDDGYDDDADWSNGVYKTRRNSKTMRRDEGRDEMTRRNDEVRNETRTIWGDGNERKR